MSGLGDTPGRLWLLAGAVLLGLGTLSFAVRGVRIETARAKKIHAVTALAAGVAFAAYLAMLLGVGVVDVSTRGGGTATLYWARYVDWLVTTPLLLLGLGLLVGVNEDTLFGAVAADAFMIVTGLVAGLSQVRAYRYVWWGISAFAFLLVVYFLVVTLTRAARRRDAETESTFTVLRNLTLVLWATYPVWWLLSTGEGALVSPSAETLGFAILDVLAKVGFGLVLLRSSAVGRGTDARDRRSSVSADPAE